MNKFIYVFDSAARDALVKAGFLLLKTDEENSMYVFSLGDALNFDAMQCEFSYITSDTLTF